MIPLYQDETMEDLQLNGLRMIQKKDGFRFGEDSVLLANYVAQILHKTNQAKRSFIDLGCNCGSISLLLSAKLPNITLHGVEITSGAAEVFERNIRLNGLENRLFGVNKNWNHLRDVFPPAETDFIVSNPPYAVTDSKISGEITDKRIAREEIYSSLDQLMEMSSYLLKPAGKAFFIYRATRLPDVLEGMRKYRIEPRTCRFILPFSQKAPTAFLISGQKFGKPGGFTIDKPLVLFDKPGHYTNEVIEMYGKFPPLTREELFSNIEHIESIEHTEAIYPEGVGR